MFFLFLYSDTPQRNMERIVISTYTLFILAFPLSVSSNNIAMLQGDIHLGGLFKIFNDEQCTSEIDAMSVRNFEAVKWTLKKLNEADYLPGITLGIEGFPTCNVQGRALEHTTRIIHRNLRDPADHTSPPIAGLIGPGYSHEAVDTSSYISSLGENNLILQTLFSTTASALSDASKYRNILRVIPDDTKQISVIISLVESLKWNYVAVIYENNEYGAGNYEGFKKRAEAKNVCIAYASAISMENGLVKSQEVQKIIESVILHTESPITGVIVFASTKTAEVFLNIANKLKNQYSFRLGMIFSEGSSDMGTETLKQFPIAKGSFFTTPPWISFDKFGVHWLNILTNKTAFNEEVSSNPWLAEIVGKFISCDIQSSSCSMPTPSIVKSVVGDNLFEGYAIVSTILHAKVLRDLHRESCGGSGGFCTSFNNTIWKNTHKLIEMGKKTQVNLNEDIPDAFRQSLIFSFNDSTDANIIGNLSDYEVHHFRYCIFRSQDMCLELVGNYRNSTLNLETELLRDYTENSAGLAWPNIIKAQCGDGKKCDSCQNGNLANEIIFKKGDVYVAAVVPVYNKDTSDPLKCADIRTSNGWEIVEGIRFAVETANEKRGSFEKLFQKKQIGYIIFNSCNQPILIQEKLLKFFSEGIKLSDGSHVSDLQKNILGFVAAYGSSISLATSPVLQDFNFPQISYASTAAVLSDRSAYKYFMRTCTPDDQQAVAMINIVKTLNSSYIQIMFSEGTYGEGGRDAIVRAARKSKICIANEIQVKENQYEKIRDDLNKTPYAAIVLLFLKSHVVEDVLVELHKVLNPWRYLFIGSEALGTRSDIISGKPKLEGTISLSLHMKPLTGTSKFERYLYDRLTDNYNDMNPWTKEYFEQKNSCFLSGSFDKTSGSQCTDIKEAFNNKDYQPELWTAFAINAMFSLLQGANKSFAELCGTQSSILCQQYRDSPQRVYDLIKNEKLVIDDSGIPSRVFNENGDGNIGYKIYQVQRKTTDTGKMIFVEIGKFTLDEDGYSIHEKTIKDPFTTLPSRCPNPLECDKCSGQIGDQSTSSPPTSEQSSTVAVILGTLFGVTFLAVITLSAMFLLKIGRGCNQTKENVDDHYLDAVPENGKQTPEECGHDFRMHQDHYLQVQ
ncbi:uncharacterized protein LOC125671591 [Ostrea edulis]|uniref:uncharacterized protein LOC125671591 n=1 Tax=Ostrea edulis TaxID=37623 RepID=UPI0024AF48FD|nr:uncharacterized protein LOC125671591 [Ostrea edulis]